MDWLNPRDIQVTRIELVIVAFAVGMLVGAIIG